MAVDTLVRDAALAVLAGGVSIIPTSSRNKQPVCSLLPLVPDKNGDLKPSWNPFRTKPADEATVRAWFDSGLASYAAACGAGSGGLLVIDFDVPRFYEVWRAAVGTLTDGLPLTRTPRHGDGYQVALRCPNPGENQKLAWAPDESEPTGRKTAIETRGEGGYAVLAPSVHPTGRRYELMSGDLANIPIVSQAQADALLAAARKLDEVPYTRDELATREGAEADAVRLHLKRKAGYNGTGSVIDAFNQAHPIDAMLDACGYRKGPRGRYIRPGGESESVSVKDGSSVHWSTDDPLNDGKVKPGFGVHDAFDIYCLKEHRGDFTSAVRAAADALGMRKPVSADVDRIRKINGKTSIVSAQGGNQPVVRKGPPPPWRPFPAAALPQPLRGYVLNAAETIGCDAAFIAPPLLAQAAAAIGNTRRIRLKVGWVEPPVLWVATVGDSGTLKSPGFDAGSRPLERRQKRLFREHERAMAEYRQEHSEWKAKPKGERGPEPELPTCPRLVVDDATVEALADRLGAAPRGLLLSREELSGWFGSFNQYKSGGKGGDVSNWLKMFGARSLTVDRKTGERKTIYVPRASVGVAGTIQPGTLRRALTPEMMDCGIAARILLAFPPNRRKQWTEAEIDPLVESQVDAVFGRLLELHPQRDADGDPEPVDVPLGSDAKGLWIDFVNESGSLQATRGGEGLIAVWSKLEGYAARFALIIHQIRHAAGEAVDAWRVDADSIAAGITLSRWFGNEAERVYARLAESDEDRDRRTLCDGIAARGGSASVRDLMRSSRRYRTADAAEAALRDLVATGWGGWEMPAHNGQRGRPAEPRFRLYDHPGADTNSETPGGSGDSVNVGAEGEEIRDGAPVIREFEPTRAERARRGPDEVDRPAANAEASAAARAPGR